MTKVFISGTNKDLADYHAAAVQACSKMGLQAIDMKHFVAEDKGATKASLDYLDECDLYIGIFAFRYGYIEEGYTKSVTELEFDRAEERDIPRLCFLIDENYDWKPALIDPDRTKINAFRKIVEKQVIAYVGTTENFQAELVAAISRWKGESPLYTTVSSAQLIIDPDDVPEKPRKLFGRDDLLKQLHTLLDDGGRALLHGFGGMGKTALAAQVAYERLKDDKGKVLWLKLGTTDAQALCEALARPFNAQQRIASIVGDERLRATRTLLRAQNLGLIVLDDAWNGSALYELIEKAIPRDVPLLVSSRHNYPMDGNSYDIAELSLNDAVALVTYHSKREDDNDLPSLCKKLGYHAFALEIAGRTMHMRNWSAAEMLQQIKDAPHEMKTPLDYGNKERSSVKDLLDTSVFALKDEILRKVFFTFGAFFVPRLTAEMLGLFMKNKLPARQRRPDVLKRIMTTHLNTLQDYGLAWRIPSDEENIEAFRIHDLAYSYASAQSLSLERDRAVKTCLGYIENYDIPSLENFCALRPELNNFMGAAIHAFTRKHWQHVEKFAWVLYIDSKFLDYQGFYSESVTLLTQAVVAARQRRDIRDEEAHLGNLGLAYESLGQYEKAIDFHTQALSITRQTGDKQGESSHLGNLGNSYHNLGLNEKAIDFHTQALSITRQIGDKQGEGTDLGNLGLDYQTLGQYDKVIDFCTQALNIARQIGDKPGEGRHLGNLGLAYDRVGKYDTALEYYSQALEIKRVIGDKEGQAINLNNFGETYEHIGDFPRSLDYYARARVIFLEIGLGYRIEEVDRNIARTLAAQADETFDDPRLL